MIRTIAVAACLFTAGSNLVAEEPHKPSFVVIMVDDMGYAGVSCFGNPYFKTPEIDRWYGDIIFD